MTSIEIEETRVGILKTTIKVQQQQQDSLTIITDRTKLPLYPATYYQQKQLIESVCNPIFLFNIQKSSPNFYYENGRCHAFVRMPYNQLGRNNSNNNLDIDNSNSSSGPTWNVIYEELTSLQKELSSSDSPDLNNLITCIRKYNPSAANVKQHNFSLLSTFLSSDGEPGTETYQNKLKSILHVIEQALALPKIIPHPIPLLQHDENKTIVMTQQQAFSLLANAFLCTFSQDSKYYPEINFLKLYSSCAGKRVGDDDVKLEKLQSIFNYFYQMYLRNNYELWSHGKVITFERRCLAEFEDPNWRCSEKSLSDVEININGKIEDCGKEMLQVDFANQFVGGEIFGDAASNEEIRFSICPELIVSRLFTERLSDEEVLIITGAEQFSIYEGSGHTFKCVDMYKDPANTDSMGRISTELVAMDAIRFYPSRKWEQFSWRSINRELLKCYTAFMLRSPTAPRIPIASGNWGCDSYNNGDPELKFLIQWLAASQSERKFVMFVFTHHEQANDIEDIVIFLRKHRVTVQKLYSILEICCAEIVREHYRGPKLFHMIQNDIRCLNIIRGETSSGQESPTNPRSLKNHNKPDYNNRNRSKKKFGASNNVRGDSQNRRRKNQNDLCVCM